MENAFSLSTDVIAAGATLAGLLLVYVGSMASAYGTFDAISQGAVKAMYLRRALIGAVGVVLTILACALAFIAKSFLSEIAQMLSLVLIFVSFAFVIWVAFATALEM